MLSLKEPAWWDVLTMDRLKKRLTGFALNDGSSGRPSVFLCDDPVCLPFKALFKLPLFSLRRLFHL